MSLMSKVVVARCNVCKKIVHEWVWQEGDVMNNIDLCEEHQ